MLGIETEKLIALSNPANAQENKEMFLSMDESGEERKNIINEIVSRNLKLIPKAFSIYHIEPTDDNFQTGCIGMMNAIGKYDPHSKVAFSTYAIPSIFWAIARETRGNLKTAPLDEKLAGEDFIDRIEEEDNRKNIREGLEKLSPDEKYIIEETYGFKCEPRTLQDIARERGCTRQRIYAIRKRALEKLRDDKGIKSLRP